ncbi:hypothetical protein ACTWP4_08170 [Gracilibacillus sp. D59]|uniref:hypothetical protein n=1 Tax=Gracilibacillus sp. D59 TaxID=3457434 RepID=UPI003FCE23CE
MLIQHFYVPLLFIIVLLSACSSKEEPIKIEDKDFADLLVVQKVENNISSQGTETIIKDKEKIKEILSIVEGVQVEEMESEQLFKEMKSGIVYMFAFFKEDGTKPKKGEYAFNILEDGTILFSYDNVGYTNIPAITTEKHINLLNKMKQTLNINY